MTYIRDDQAAISVTVNGQPYGDSWKEADGGSLDVPTDIKVRAGGMGKEVSIGGLASRGDLTVRTNMTDITAGWVRPLEAVVGSGRVVVGLTWLGPDGAPMPGADALTRRGTLKTVTVPNMGANSNLAMFELVISCDELAG